MAPRTTPRSRCGARSRRGTAASFSERVAWIRACAPVGWFVATVAVAAPVVGQDTRAPAEPALAVTSARLTAVIAADADGVEVELEYRLNRAPTPSDGPIRVHVLGVGGSRVESFELASEPDGRRYVLTADDEVRRATEIDPTALGAGIDVRYRVASAVRDENGAVRVDLPVLVLDLAPGPPTPATFEAAVTVPEGWAVASTFPSGLAADGPVWSGDLQVVPAFVAVRARTDGQWRPGLPWALDVATVLILAGVSFIGWRHLSGVVREARA